LFDKNTQDVRWYWQELGVEAPRIEVRERLGSVLEGTKREKECNATAVLLNAERLLRVSVKTDWSNKETMEETSLRHTA
jgi:hypothetical protein